MLGTNGGGFLNANAAHPFENPTPFSNFIQMLSIFAIPTGLTYYLGRMTKNQGHGWAVWGAMFSMFEQMDALHPQEPHWHLPLIGVDPAHQGKGIGSALLSHILDVCDAQNVSAYLEATSPQNVPLYERHGFEAVGSIQVADSPQIIPMLRKPRPMP